MLAGPSYKLTDPGTLRQCADVVLVYGFRVICPGRAILVRDGAQPIIFGQLFGDCLIAISCFVARELVFALQRDLRHGRTGRHCRSNYQYRTGGSTRPKNPMHREVLPLEKIAFLTHLVAMSASRVQYVGVRSVGNSRSWRNL